MATPLSSPSPKLAHSPPMSEKTRKVTQLRSLSARLVGLERPLVHVDPNNGKVVSPYRKKLRTYLGVIAQDKVDVTYINYKQTPASQNDLIWEDIQVFQLNLVCYGNWMY